MEALAAVGLAGNIVQFITFSCELISKSRDIRQSSTGVLNQTIDLGLISTDIRTSIKRITSDANSPHLSVITDRCEEVANELQQAIAKLELRHQGLASKKISTQWQSFRKALKCVLGKPRLDDLVMRLEMLRNQVMMHMVSNLKDTQDRFVSLLAAYNQGNIHSGERIAKRFQDLNIKLLDTEKRISRIHDDDYWKKLHGVFSEVFLEMDQLSQTHAILTSLRYECMDIREDVINNANERTFAWVYSHNTHQSSDSAPRVNFVEWLKSGYGIYWVTGKPGSGKSTLMKYLYDHEDNIRHLSAWSKDVPLVRASFYFWNSGQRMQKSLEGLLQTLLYHILCACPHLVQHICSQRVSNQSQGILSAKPWTLTELRSAFSKFMEHSHLATNFYFHIDGIDEFGGDSWDIIKMLLKLSKVPNVKLCLSSRPWNCFQDAFGRSNPNMLLLHELTRGDIELFARETLTLYSIHTNLEMEIFDDLIREIGDRSQGVFLWVRLVVRSLRDGIINDDPMSILHERLAALPSDLENFFELMLSSVEDIYRTRMATTFLAAIKASQPLKIIHYYFMEEDDNINGFQLPAELWGDARIHEKVIRTQRRLNGRFKGLLEPASIRNIGYQTTVDFLHRTMRDFLTTNRMSQKLRAWASSEIDGFTAVSRALISESKFVHKHPPICLLKSAVEFANRAAVETGHTTQCYEIIHQAELANERSRPNHSTCGLNCYILRFAAYVGQTQYLRYRFNQDESVLNLSQILAHSIDCPFDSDETFERSICISSSHTSNPYLPNNWCNGCNPDGPENVLLVPELVSLLCALGADPNEMVNDTSSWCLFLSVAPRLMDGEQKNRCWAVLKIFLEKGVDLSIMTDAWGKILNRPHATSKDNMRNTLRYFKRLFHHGLNRNVMTPDGTLTFCFLETMILRSKHLPVKICNIQHDLFREFLQKGADVSQIYKDKSSPGWLNDFLRELREDFTPRFLSPRIVQLRLLFAHCLDPNSFINSSKTVWEYLLEAVCCGVQNAPQDAYLLTIHRVIILGLSYGADPHNIKLQPFLSWMRSPSCLFSPSEVRHIEQALQKELDRSKSQVCSSRLALVDNRIGSSLLETDFADRLQIEPK